MSGAQEGNGRCGFVALLGWTNVGKSTLLNRLLGDKVAAVADVPQTTRNRIVGVLTLPGRGQIAFVDTPGLHRARYRMNRVMVEAVRQAVDGVDLVVLVIDAAHGIGPGDRKASEMAAGRGAERIAVLNKIDLVRPKSRLLPMMRVLAEEWGIPEIVPLSARTGEGCDLLLDRVFAALPEGPRLYPADFLTDQPERVLAAEWIREKLLHHTRQELPHATAVLVDRWNEREDGLIEIEAGIVVDRESQKAIVIGREGGMLKRVGSEARREIEALLGRRVFLRLRVRVRPDWRDDPRLLRDLGIDA